MKVLIIEDNDDMRVGLARFIETNWKSDIPLVIVSVGTLAEGLEQSHDSNVTLLDLTLTDAGMVDTIRAIPAFPPPVIVMTGTDDPEVTAACIAAGAAHVHVKGSMFGFLPLFFEALQHDLNRRANARENVGSAQ